MTTKKNEKKRAKQQPPSPGRDELLEMAREEVRKAGGKRLTFNEFVGRSGLRPNDVQRHFARWTDVLKATGLRLGREELPIPTERLLEDWGSVAQELGRAPTPADYKVRGVFSLPTLAERLGRWGDVREAFLKFAKGKGEWNEVRKRMTNDEFRMTKRRSGEQGRRRGNGVARTSAYRNGVSERGAKTTRRLPNPAHNAPRGEAGVERKRWVTRRRRVSDMIYGDRIEFEALQHAPTNEQGVVFLFGMLAGRMGYVVDGLRPGFPDCEARRQVDATRWERVRIEFEFESRNFLEHGHAKEGCDVIVCWRDNWPGCPVEVIALRDFVAQREMTNDE